MHGCEIRIYPAFADSHTTPGTGIFKVLGTSVIIRIGQISDDSPAVAVEPVQTIEELPELFRAVAAAMHLVNAWERQRGNEPPFDLTKLTQGLFSGRDCRANIPSSSDSGEIVPGHRTRYDLPLFVRIS